MQSTDKRADNSSSAQIKEPEQKVSTVFLFCFERFRSGGSGGDPSSAARSGPAALAFADAGRGQQSGSSTVAVSVAALRENASERARQAGSGHFAREEEQHLLRHRYHVHYEQQVVIHHDGYAFF